MGAIAMRIPAKSMSGVPKFASTVAARKRRARSPPARLRRRSRLAQGLGCIHAPLSRLPPQT
eukprot:6199499-Pleurochrysis_carterae.AAC.2